MKAEVFDYKKGGDGQWALSPDDEARRVEWLAELLSNCCGARRVAETEQTEGA